MKFFSFYAFAVEKAIALQGVVRATVGPEARQEFCREQSHAAGDLAGQT